MLILQYIVKVFLVTVNYKIFYVSLKLERIQETEHNVFKSNVVFDRHAREKS